MSRFKNVLAAIAAAALLVGACGGSTATDTQLDLASVDEIVGIIDTPPTDLVVLDIRTPEEFASGHLAGAINIDFYAEDFSDQLSELDLTKPYVMYCRSGNRSSQALPMMEGIGFETVHELDGGINAWQAAGNPIER